MTGADRQGSEDRGEVEYIEDPSATRRYGRPIRYVKGKFLGKGGFAKCYECTDCETKQVYAIKIVNKESVQKPRAYAKLKSEIAIHRNLSHERVVKMYGHFEDQQNVYILLELCPSQTLNDLLRKRRRFTEAEALYYMYDLIIGVKYLHHHRVLHRDLKLGNLFLDDNMKLKIGDFGLAAQLEHDGEKKKTICGTPNYIAPEILDGKTGHSYEVDIWSLGVILYTCLFGRPPFETNDVKQTYRKIRHSQYSFPEHPPVSAAAKQLITAILRVEPKARPNLDQIQDMAWMRSGQVPPALPSALLSTTPRPASARSDTPERGTIEFARIDSPVSSMNRVVSASGSERPCSPRTPLLRPGETTPKRVDGVAGSGTGIVRRSERPGPPLPNSARSARPPTRGPIGDENAAPAGAFVPAETATREVQERPLGEKQAMPGNIMPSATAKADLKHGPASTQALLNHRPQTASPLLGCGTTRTSPLGATGSSDRNRDVTPNRHPTPPPAARRQPSYEPAPVSARTPKPAVSPRTTALRLTPRNGPVVTASTSSANGRASPLRGTTPISRDVRTPTAAPGTSSSQGLLSPAQLVDALGGVSSPTRSSSARRSYSARALGVLPQTAETRETWVVQWMDYTCKYGVGYFLSDGSCGVYFNDSTKIVQPAGGSKFEYVTRRVYDQPEQKSTHTWSDYPQDLHKKATLLKHFHHYMYQNEQKEGVTSGTSSMQGNTEPGGAQLYVKKWMRSRHAILFQLSNKLVQVHFLVDETELLFSSRYQVVTYVDKKKEKHTYPLQTILDVPNPELSKRLRYAKDMLVNLVGGSEKPKPKA